LEVSGVVTLATKARIASLAAPSFHEGSTSFASGPRLGSDAACVGYASASASLGPQLTAADSSKKPSGRAALRVVVTKLNMVEFQTRRVLGRPHQWPGVRFARGLVA
jgi:hypothetical protein